ALQLQAMLKRAQKLVSRAQVVKVRATEVAFVMQFLQGEQRAASAQPRLFTAVHALQTLHKEFDIANAAAVELYINGGRPPAQRQRAPPMLADLAARMDGSFNRGEIDVRSINARLDGTKKFARQIRIARRISRLDQGLELPIVGGAGV